MIIWGLLEIAWGLIVILLGTLITFLAFVAADLLLQAWNWVMGLKADMKSLGKVVGLVLAVIGMVVAFMMGAPIIVIAAVGLLMYAVGKWVVDNMKGPALYVTLGIIALALAGVILFFFTWPVLIGVIIAGALIAFGLWLGKSMQDILMYIINPISLVIDIISAAVIKIKEIFEDDPDKGLWDSGLGPMLGFADGGVTKGGISLVGERGPEIVRMPVGSRVHSNTESKQMMGGVTNNINITINAKDTSDTELRRIADKIGNMVNNKINRRTSSGTMR
jgi:hypothetical protein